MPVSKHARSWNGRLNRRDVRERGRVIHATSIGVHMILSLWETPHRALESDADLNLGVM